MEEKELKISNELYEGNSTCFSNLIEINNFDPKGKETLLNLSGFVEANPFNMLVLALTIRKRRKYWDKARYRCPKYEKTDRYLQYMGFYETCGIQNREVKRGGRRAGKYICISEINFTPQGSISADYELIENESKKLTEMFQFDDKLAKYLQYCFFEMMRNVYEHSGAKSVFVCAQYWPLHELMEIAIADEGCGIQKAMRTRFENLGELDSLEYAMTPGISALSNHAYLDKDDYYGNSGYGLYMTKELALTYGGNFTLCSGNYAKKYFVKDFEQFSRTIKTKFDGTAIAIRFRTNCDIHFSDEIKRILLEAEKEASKHVGAINRASKSSGGVSRNL